AGLALSCPGRLLAAGAAAREASRVGGPAGSAAADPTPRLPDGTPNLGPLEDGKGFWDRGSGPLVGGADYPPPDEIPFRPWARALFDYRQSTLAQDDPHVRCAPPGGPRQSLCLSGSRSFRCRRSSASSSCLAARPGHGARSTWTGGRIRRRSSSTRATSATRSGTGKATRW